MVDAKEEGGDTLLRRNRRTTRQDAWRAVAILQEVAPPNTSLQPTLVSKDIESLPWEVLE
jgi:hypothetical protein